MPNPPFCFSGDALLKSPQKPGEPDAAFTKPFRLPASFRHKPVAPDSVPAQPLEPETVQPEPEEKRCAARLFNPAFTSATAFFQTKVKASVEAEFSDPASPRRVLFELFTLLPWGGRERIEGMEGVVPRKDKALRAEVEFTLYYPQGRNSDGNLLKECDFVFTVKHPDAKTVESAPLAVQSPPCTDKPDPAPAEVVGTCPYYTWRYRNFRLRHPSCDRRPPTYYLGYGYKYCQRFTLQTHPKLSPVGKKWLFQAKLNLQIAIEIGLREDDKNTLEIDSDRFKDFAFKSHPKAYWEAGMKDLPLTDLIIIGLTPDVKEWMDKGTWAQAFDIGGRLGEVTLSEMQQAAKDRAEGIVEYFKEIFR